MTAPFYFAGTKAIDVTEAAEGAERAGRFLLQIVQPGLAGLMDGSVSLLAPIFAKAFATRQPFTALLVGIAAAMGWRPSSNG